MNKDGDISKRYLIKSKKQMTELYVSYDLFLSERIHTKLFKVIISEKGRETGYGDAAT